VAGLRVGLAALILWASAPLTGARPPKSRKALAGSRFPAPCTHVFHLHPAHLDDVSGVIVFGDRPFAAMHASRGAYLALRDRC
jgi:hypothetical protein